MIRAAAAALAVLALPAAKGPSALPNLVQLPPAELQVIDVAGRWHLGFTSAVANTGPGPLLVAGARGSRSEPAMRAEQVVAGRAVARVGTLRFVRNPTHDHWHLLPFETYTLRRPGLDELVASAHKQGFCISDDRSLPGAGQARHVAQCGLGRPDLLRLGEGLSPGWEDVYGPQREGQFLDVTDVPAGRYVVVNAVNVGRAMRETSYEDDVAGTLIDLSRAAGPSQAPTVTVVGTCAGTRACALDGVPP